MSEEVGVKLMEEEGWKWWEMESWVVRKLKKNAANKGQPERVQWETTQGRERLHEDEIYEG